MHLGQVLQAKLGAEALLEGTGSSSLLECSGSRPVRQGGLSLSDRAACPVCLSALSVGDRQGWQDKDKDKDKDFVG